MLVFYLGFLSLLLATLYSLGKRDEKTILGGYLFFVFLISHGVLIGFRDYTSGSDTLSYIYNYTLVQQGYALPSTEIIFTSLLELFSLASLSARGFLLAVTLLFILLLLAIRSRFDFETGLIVILGVVSGSTFLDLETNGLRQGLAMLLAIVALLHFRGVQALIMFVIAALTHYSSLILFLFYLLSAVSFFKGRVVVAALAASVIGLLTLSVFGLNPISLDSSTFLNYGDLLFEKFSGYVENDTAGKFEQLSFVGRLSYALPCIFVASLYFWMRDSADFIKMYLIFLFSVIFYLVLASTGYSYRWSYYSLLLAPVVIGLFLDGVGGNKWRMIFSLSISFVYFIWGSFSVWYLNILYWKSNAVLQVV